MYVLDILQRTVFICHNYNKLPKKMILFMYELKMLMNQETYMLILAPMN